MSASQVIDYDALAKQHGGSAAVDYDALAAQHGGKAAVTMSQTLDPNQPGMQPAVNGLAPRYAPDKSEETVGRMVEHAKAVISAPFEAGVQLVHDLRTGESHGPHNIEKYGIVRGTAKTIADSFKNLNPVAPDTGQGPLNRVADTVGNVEGMGIAAEAVPSAEEAAAAKAKTGQLANSVINTVKNAPETAINAAKTAVNSKPVNFFADINKARTAGKVVGGVGGGLAGATHGPLGAVIGAERGAALGGRMGVGASKVLAKLRDTLNAHAADIPENPTASAESNFAEVGSREPEVVHDEDLVTAAPAKVKAILDKAEADIKQITTPKEQKPAAPGSAEDKLDDRALSQEMGWDIAKHYYKGLAEQRDMAASSLSSKTELTTGAQVDAIMAKAVADATDVLRSAKITAEVPRSKIEAKIASAAKARGRDFSVPRQPEDLSDLLKRSIDIAKAKKGPGSGGEGNGGAK